MKIFDRTLDVLQRTLDLRATRHQVIATNLANEETPGYRAKEYQFLDVLASAARPEPHGRLAVTHANHQGPRGGTLRQVKGTVVDLPAPDLPLDGNSVNLELEMAKLADNAMNYNTASQIVAIRFRQLLAAIRDAK